MPASSRQRLQKRPEAVDVEGPPRRQLIQHGAERCAELRRPREEAMQRVARLFQFLHVRQVAARLHRIEKSARRALSPCVERVGFREAIERVVDLDRIEALGVILEPSRLPELCRIKISSPMLILPTRAADTYVKL